MIKRASIERMEVGSGSGIIHIKERRERDENNCMLIRQGLLKKSFVQQLR